MDPLPSDAKILAVDVGGSGIKAAVLDPNGQMLTQRARVKTPRPLTRELLVDTIVQLVGPLGDFSHVSVGFPGVLRRGKIVTAPNLGTEVLGGFDLAGALSERLQRPVRIINDADMQGLAVVRGEGLELVITLGTGMGSALFFQGQLCPHLEISQHPFRKGEDYDKQIGDATLAKIGDAKWKRRVQRAIKNLRNLTNFDRLYIGGGNARKVDFDLGTDMEIISNENGVKGGAWLWREGVYKE
jgi:polyphosphate glucokinase